MQTSSSPGSNDLRVLVMTPTGRDASLICQLLRRVGIPCEKCSSWESLLTDIRFGAGAFLIAEEALTSEVVDTLSKLIGDQPPWSDFPLLLLTAAGAVSNSSLRRLEMQKPLGNVQLLERPIRPETLVSTVRAALRARARQYQIRDQLRQQRQAEEALRKSEKLAVAGRMAASIAHEINNPLESVTNLLYLSSTSEHISDIKKYLATATQELERVSAIATHTLRFYREPTEPAPVNICEVVDSVLSLFCSRLNSCNIDVKKSCAAELPLIVGLAGELRQLLANLIGNALDAMRNGGILTVRVHRASERSKAGRQGIRVVIADTGHGIRPEQKAKIFEPFFTTKGQTGTGLGLWISSEIVSKHHGTLRLKSRVSSQRSGTVFCIFLPETPSAAASSASPVRRSA